METKSTINAKHLMQIIHYEWDGITDEIIDGFRRYAKYMTDLGEAISDWDEMRQKEKKLYIQSEKSK
jgi:hypothetical protein